MTRLLLLILISFTVITLSSCRQKRIEPNVEKALSNTISKFEQLPKGKGNQSSYYKLVRSVIIGDNGIELQLRSAPETLDDAQKIIIVVNQQKEVYAIPLFSNTYHDYWNFKFDSIITSLKPTNSTFEKELKACLKQLNLYDTLGTAGEVINEMFFSLLRCQQVTETDSLNINSLALITNNKLPDENFDICYKRLNESWKEISIAFRPEGHRVSYNSYWDRKNNRVYKFDFKNFNRIQKLEFDVTNYRLDCVFQTLDL